MLLLQSIKRSISLHFEKLYWGKIEKKVGGNILTKVDTRDEHRLYYAVTPYHHLKFIEKYLQSVKITSKDSLFDVGCGRGV